MKKDMKDSIIHYGVGCLPEQQDQRGVSVSCATRVDWPCHLAPVSKLRLGVEKSFTGNLARTPCGVEEIPVKCRNA